MESTVPNGPDSFADKANELVMSFDLTVAEARRRAAVLQAIGAQWDPAVGLANDLAAYGLLYSELDGPHQRIYDDLVAAGVHPRRRSGNDVADSTAAGERGWDVPPVTTATAARTARPDATAQFTGSTCFGMKARA